MLDVSRTTCSSTTGTGLLIKLTTSIGGLSENGTADKSAKDLNGDLLRAWKNNHSRYYLLLHNQALQLSLHLKPIILSE